MSTYENFAAFSSYLDIHAPFNGYVTERRLHVGSFVGPDGTGTFTVFMKGLTLKDGKYAVNGLSIILHEKVDDFTQPGGNTGGRIACGLIETK